METKEINILLNQLNQTKGAAVILCIASNRQFTLSQVALHLESTTVMKKPKIDQSQ